MLRNTLLGIAALSLISAQAIQAAAIKPSNAVVAWHKAAPVDRTSADLANKDGLASGLPAWLIIALLAGGGVAAAKIFHWFQDHGHSPF